MNKIDAGGGNFEGFRFNIIKHRGDPQTAETLSGHTVKKESHVYLKSPYDNKVISLRCADYHGEHFVYINPMYEKDGSDGLGQWFAMCTCGSPAVIIGPMAAQSHDEGLWENMLVCYAFAMTQASHGHGWHQGQEPRKKWK
jgi:hypothetical protein